MSTKAKEKLPPIRELSSDEGRDLFDRQARKYLGITGDEFIRRLDAGEYSEDELEHPDLIRVAMLRPLARK